MAELTAQEQITAMKVKLSEMINQKNRLDIDIRNLNIIIAKLETIAESASNPNLATELIKTVEVPE